MTSFTIALKVDLKNRLRQQMRDLSEMTFIPVSARITDCGPSPNDLLTRVLK